ncbi:ParA family protein [Psychrobacter sp. LV10R520-6]|uniref:ParA family protein n=1 Tax=Psychrobacter sp. LV10R520-6 TaxID=1415574 RepID=UPI0024C64056|nr:AAA family ATPase [Psychrobacter sp. LV10R520-6]SNT71322.1 CobQ/CobB/MinD/ParA nucleotide binding domain-containing protein [Psychrobacter sp. LV10R520-6]
MSKRIAVFNHKGGVSKTTSVYNIGWLLSKNLNVLVVDADPQCNLTSLILGEGFEKYYIKDETKLQNIKDGVSAAFLGRPHPIEAVTCYSPERADNLFLLAGHANLSEYDAALTFAQTSNNAIATLQNLPGAFSELLRLTEEKYSIDITIIDLNPSLSAINQNLFLSSDSFIVPTNPDPFSLMAIDTLTRVLPKWVQWKQASMDMFKDSAYPMPESHPKFLGSLIQRFNVRNGLAARPYRDNISEIKQKISNEFYDSISNAGMTLDGFYSENLISEGYCLAEIPDFQGLLPKSNKAQVPVFALLDEEIEYSGKVLETMLTKRDHLLTIFEGLETNLTRLLDHV